MKKWHIVAIIVFAVVVLGIWFAPVVPADEGDIITVPEYVKRKIRRLPNVEPT